MISLKAIFFAIQICFSTCFKENEFNKGWQTYFGNEPTEFHDIPLSWTTNSTVPAWLYGTFMKNGPGQKSFGDEDRYYGQYGDSWAKIHKITFNEGRLTYSGRMLESKNYVKCRDAGKIVPSVTFGPIRPNDWSLAEDITANMNGNVNPNVAFHKLGPESDPEGVYIATTDIQTAVQFDPHTLEGMGELTLNAGGVRLMLTSSAHWRREVGADTSLNFYISLSMLTNQYHLSLYRYGSTWNDRHQIAFFDIPYLSLIHQISNTPNYAVIMFYPVSIDIMEMLQNNFHPIEATIKMDEPTTFYLVDLRDGSVIDGFESWDPALVYATHHANAYEEDGEIILDVSCNPWDSLKTSLDVDIVLNWEETGATQSQSHMKRIRLDLATKDVVVEEWDNELGTSFINTFDFPIINPQYTGIKHRYVYGWAQLDYWHDYLIKKDLEDSANDLTWFLPSHYPHETIFVPNPDAVSEDDGVLITVVFDGARETSYLLLLDGITFTEINRADLPFMIPFPVHGQWFPNLV